MHGLNAKVTGMRKVSWWTLAIPALAAVVLAGSSRAAAETPMGTAFTYQGQLKLGGLPVTDFCNLEFSLWDSEEGGDQIGTTQYVLLEEIVGGLFTVLLDFGPVFDGNARWLEIAVQCPGDPEATILTPRQELTPTPYAIHAASAETVPWSGLTGLSCGSGQLAKWDGSAWACADDIDTDTLGGLSCANGQVAKSNGTDWVCGDDIDTTYDGSDFALSSQSCTPGDVVTGVDAVGNLICAPDADTLGALPCANGKVAKWDGAAWICDNDLDSGGDITRVDAKDGLLGGGDTGDINVSVDFAGTGSTTTVARSDHDHDADYAALEHAHSSLVAADGDPDDALIVDNSGNVGIGRINPSATLDVDGTLLLQSGNAINEFSADGTLGDDSDLAAPTERAVKTYVDTQVALSAAVPVGTVTAWLKSFANTPALLDGWVECNGQFLSDPESDYDGQTIPDLNGASGVQRFLRGSTYSETTGGSETHTHSIPPATEQGLGGETTKAKLIQPTQLQRFPAITRLSG